MKHLKGLSWIDWVKLIVAIDIAAVGVGLIFQENIHILANIAGPISKIIFGVLYIGVAVFIFKAVFPELFDKAALAGAVPSHSEGSKSEVKHDAHPGHGKKIAAKDSEPQETVGEIIDKAAHKANDFVKERTEEVKEEVRKMME